MAKFLLFLFYASCILHVSAQSLTGTNGLFKIPSAYIGKDGQSYIGVSFYPKGSYELYNSGDLFTGMPSFITLALYDRVEVMFRYTHQLNQEVNYETRYFPDRMFSFRYNVFKEHENLPAITLGLHDVSSAFGGTTASPWFLATYLIASKTINTNGFNISPTLGYAFDLFRSKRNRVFDGLLYGVEFTYKGLPNFSFLGEYDSSAMNIALKATFLSHFHFAVGLLNMQSPSAFLTYRFNLSNR